MDEYRSTACIVTSPKERLAVCLVGKFRKDWKCGLVEMQSIRCDTDEYWQGTTVGYAVVIWRSGSARKRWCMVEVDVQQNEYGEVLWTIVAVGDVGGRGDRSGLGSRTGLRRSREPTWQAEQGMDDGRTVRATNSPLRWADVSDRQQGNALARTWRGSGPGEGEGERDAGDEMSADQDPSESRRVGNCSSVVWPQANHGRDSRRRGDNGAC